MKVGKIGNAIRTLGNDAKGKSSVAKRQYWGQNSCKNSSQETTRRPANIPFKPRQPREKLPSTTQSLRKLTITQSKEQLKRQRGYMDPLIRPLVDGEDFDFIRQNFNQPPENSGKTSLQNSD